MKKERGLDESLRPRKLKLSTMPQRYHSIGKRTKLAATKLRL